jgi:hypothetical protein
MDQASDPEPSRQTPDGPGTPGWRLALLLAAEVVALAAFNSPNERFTRFAYNDSGADLTVQAMTARGLRPTVDFGYIYGLLPLLINRAWYGAFGTSPAAFRALTLACDLALAWGMARFASALRVGPAGVVLIVVAMPDVMLTSTIVLVHALEPALLVNALALQARGRRGAALALATAGLFVKPSMPYLYGLVLLLAVVAADRGRAWRALVPAAATGLGLAAVLGVAYGTGPLLATLLPGAGLEVYRQNGYGFFRGAGRAFWLIPGGGLRDYLRYEVGSWLAGSAVLVLGGAAAAGRLARGRGSRNDEMVLTCAALHGGFVTLFFGNRVSWVYYYAVLVLGLAALAARGRRHAAVVAVLAVLVLVGSRVKFETTARLWRTDAPSAVTLGLWASPAERAEWSAVRALVRDHPPAALLARVDGLGVLLPGEFLRPEVAYLVPGHPVPAEIRRKADQVASAGLVVLVRPRGDPSRGGYARWPEIAAALDGCQTVFDGDLFEVARRARPPAGLTGAGR